MHGWWLVCSGEDPGGGLKMLATGVVEWRAAGALNTEPYFLSLLAEAHLARGDYEAAANVVARAIDTARSTGEVWWTPLAVATPGGRDRGAAAMWR